MYGMFLFLSLIYEQMHDGDICTVYGGNGRKHNKKMASLALKTPL